MSAHRRGAARPPKLVATVAAGAVLVSMGFWLSPTQAAETPSPEPTTTEGDHATNPAYTPPETVDTYVGQSIQARKTADGVQNAQLANFRWAVTQVNAETLNGLDVSIPLPMDDTPALRSLTGRSNSPTSVDDGVLYDFDDVDGIQTKRTLNLWPQDRELPVDVTAEFTLDGEKVHAADIVGKGGLVTAKYTIVNKSIETQDVKFDNVKGNPDTQEVETSQAFVGISKQFIPQSWAQFDPGHGIFGADGRGNFQTQWISLAFLPFAEGGEASFGWSAVIPDGEGFIPKMVIEVSPLYVPTHAEAEEEQSASSSNGVPRPNLDSATASVHSGVEDLVAGVSSLADTVGAATGATKEGISIAVSQIKAAVSELCSPDLLYCDEPEDPDPLTLSEAIAALDAATAAINAYVAGSEGTTDPKLLVDYLNRIEEDVTEARTEAENAKSEAETGLSEAQKELTDLEAKNEAVCLSVNAGPEPPEEDTKVLCAAIAAAIASTKIQITQFEATIAKANLTIAAATAALGVVDEAQAYVDENIGNLSTEKLRDLGEKLTGINDTLKTVQAKIEVLRPPLADLQAGIDQIGAAIDAGGAILGDVGSSLDQISAGRAQISAGLGQAGDEVGAYIADVVAVAKAAAESGKDAAAQVEAHANTIKAQLAGLKGRMAESPLPYGGGYNTAYAPAGDAAAVQSAATSMLPNTTLEPVSTGVAQTAELFGAYQFMLDPADSNKPNTPWRILLALLFVVGAGFLGKRVADRRAAA